MFFDSPLSMMFTDIYIYIYCLSTIQAVSVENGNSKII